MHHSKRPSPPLASIAKKISPSVAEAEAVVVGRTADAGRTPEAALEPGTPSRSDKKTQ